MELNIREALLKDARQMAALDKICFSHPWSRQSFVEELGDNDLSFYIVVEGGGEIIAYAGLWMVLDEGHITNLAVHPSHRGKGLGEKLLRELIGRATNRGIRKFTLEVRPSNKSAIKLYKKLAFKPVGIRKEYYLDNLEDALIFWLD